MAGDLGKPAKSTTSHDLRSSARQIKSFTQMLEMHLHEGADSETLEYLRILNIAADALWKQIEALELLAPPKTS